MQWSSVGLLTGLGAYLSLMLGATILAPSSYSWLNHTISTLGSQGFPRAYLMRCGFVLLGACATGQAWMISLRLPVGWQKLLILGTLGIYGLSVALTGIFSQESVGSEVLNRAALLHQLFARVAGVCFFAGSVAVAWCFREQRDVAYCSLGVFVLGTLCSALFFVYPELQGLWQRLLHSICVLWLGLLVWMIR